LLGIFFAGFCTIFIRLFYLTVVKGSYYQDLSNNNRIREEQIPPDRGILFDRENLVLTQNRPIYKQCNEQGSGECRYLKRDDAIAKEAEGEKVIVELGRHYPVSALTAHLIGYMSEISADQFEQLNAELKEKEASGDKFCQTCYRLGDYIGAYGVEQTFETRLRGIPGKRLVEVDAVGNELQELKRIEPVSGENITLALDLDLQKAGIAALENTLTSVGDAGAIIALNPKNGEVMAFYSSPSFNPNMFVFSDPLEIEEFMRSDEPDKSDTDAFSNTEAARIIDEENTNTSLSDILTNAKRPLFNRVISGLYPPASTFKIIIATAGLEEGVLNKDTTVEDTGIISIGKFSFTNWYFTQYGRTEGEVDMEQALARSNDIFFYKVGEWLGIDNITKWAKEYGLQQKTGIELKDELEGIIKRDRTWYLGDTYHIAIGQGDLLVTPIQVASWTQAVANNGKRCRPTVLKLNGKEGDCHEMPVSKDSLRLIQNGLARACSPGGTGYPLFDFSVNTASSSASTRIFDTTSQNFIPLENGGTKIPVACKTGTGEFGDGKKTHAWLTAYAPAEDPEIVVTVLVEAGGEGSTVSAPIVKKMFEEWFSRERLLH
jgi:penicillin-binding protein 2